MKFSKIALLFFSLSFFNSFSQTKKIELELEAPIYAQFILSWKEYGQVKQYVSGEKEGNGFSHTQNMHEDASDINIRVIVFRPWPLQSEKLCSRNLGTAAGKFSVKGDLVTTDCKWVPSGNGGSTVFANIEDINRILPGGNTNLHLAVKTKDAEQIKSLIRNGIEHMETKNARGFTPLHEAIQIKSIDMVSLLINNNADLNQTNNKNQTPLYMAVNLGAVDIVQTLFDFGCDANNAFVELERAIVKRDQDMVQLFMDNDADANVILDFAVKANNTDVIALAIDEGGAIPTYEVFKKAVDTRKFQLAESFLDNPQSDIDPTAAMDYAIVKNANTLVEKALQNGANAQKGLDYAIQNKDVVLAADAITLYGANPNLVLYKVVASRNLPMLDVLLTNECDASQALEYAIDGADDKMVQKIMEYSPTVTASHMGKASKDGNNEVLKTLIVQGNADPNDGLVPAMQAAQYKTAEILIQAGATPTDNMVKIAISQNQKELLIAALDNNADPTPGLELAINKGSVPYTKLLIDAGANDISDASMAVAANSKNLEMVKLLLSANGDAQAALEPAVLANAYEIVNLLLQNNANGNDNDLLKKSVVHNNVSLTKLFVEAGSDAQMIVAEAAAKAPNVLNYIISKGIDVTPQNYLDAAVNSGNTKSAEILINNKADAAYIDSSGNTYLHKAVQQSNTSLAALLVSKGGVDVNQANNDNETPLHIAVRKGRSNHAMVNYLVGVGADVNAKDKNGETALSFAKGSKVKKALKSAGGK